MSDGFKNEAEGYAASLRQMADMISGWDGGDPDELVDAADFIERQQAEHELMRRTLEIIVGTASDRLQATQARGALTNIGPKIE